MKENPSGKSSEDETAFTDSPKNTAKKFIRGRIARIFVPLLGRGVFQRTVLVIGVASVALTVYSRLSRERLVLNGLYEIGLHTDLSSEYQKDRAVQKMLNYEKPKEANEAEEKRVKYEGAVKKFAQFSLYTEPNPKSVSTVASLARQLGKGRVEESRMALEDLYQLMATNAKLTYEQLGYLELIQLHTRQLQLIEIDNLLLGVSPSQSDTRRNAKRSREYRKELLEFASLNDAWDYILEALTLRDYSGDCDAIGLANLAVKTAQKHEQDHPYRVAQILNGATWVYYDAGQRQLAYENAKNALEIVENSFGIRSPESIGLLYSRGFTMLALRNYEEIVSFYEKRIRAINKERDPENWYLNAKTQGFAEMKLGRKTELGTILEAHYAENKKKYGPDSVFTAWSAMEYSQYLYGTGKKDEGVQLLTSARKIFDTSQSKAGKGFVQSSCWLIGDYLGLGRTQEAIYELKEVIRVGGRNPNSLKHCSSERIFEDLTKDRNAVDPEILQLVQSIESLVSSNNLNCE